MSSKVAFFLLIQIATDEKDSILASVPTNLKEKGSTLHASLIDGKVYEGTLEESFTIYKKASVDVQYLNEERSETLTL